MCVSFVLGKVHGAEFSTVSTRLSISHSTVEETLLKKLPENDEQNGTEGCINATFRKMIYSPSKCLFQHINNMRIRDNFLCQLYLVYNQMVYIKNEVHIGTALIYQWLSVAHLYKNRKKIIFELMYSE